MRASSDSKETVMKYDKFENAIRSHANVITARLIGIMETTSGWHDMRGVVVQRLPFIIESEIKEMMIRMLVEETK
jgi:hypothetical protein